METLKWLVSCIVWRFGGIWIDLSVSADSGLCEFNDSHFLVQLSIALCMVCFSECLFPRAIEPIESWPRPEQYSGSIVQPFKIRRLGHRCDSEIIPNSAKFLKVPRLHHVVP